LYLIWSNAPIILSISSSLVLTGVMYTILLTCLYKKSREASDPEIVLAMRPLCDL
jgi:hypothetical protein